MAQTSASSSPGGGPSSFSNWLYYFRYILLVLCSILNVANLALIAHWLSGSVADDVVYGFEIIGIVSAVLTFVLIPAMLFVARVRKNAWFVYILTEVVIFGILWVLWTATAALAIQAFNNLYLGDCSIWIPAFRQWCDQLSAIRGLSVAIFVLLLLYVLTLLIFAIVRTSTVGSGVWFQTVQEQRLWSPTTSGGAAPTTQTAAHGSPSMWDEKPANAAHSEVATTPVGGALPGHALQASPAPPSGVTAHPPSPLAQALAMNMGGTNSTGAAGPTLSAVGSSITSLPAGAGVGPGAGPGQQYSPAPQQLNMHVSRTSPRQQAAGLQNATGNQGAPVTPSYPQP